MKIKRFLAADIRQALQQVRETLGAEAVILSNRKTDRGVEIIAACDFELETVASNGLKPKPPEPAKMPEEDAQPVPKPKVIPKPAFSARGYSAVAEFSKGAPEPSTPAQPVSPPQDALSKLQHELQQMRHLLDRHLAREGRYAETSPTRLDLLRTLSSLGFARQFAIDLARQVAADDDLTSALRKVRQIVSERLPVLDDPVLDCGGIIALVGPTGVGKTTTIAKLAAQFRLEHGPRQVALVTLDNYRIAAYEQLATYARILGIPIRGTSTQEGLRAVLRGFSDKRLVLIDTAGMSPRDVRLAEQLALLDDSGMRVTTYLVLAASAQLPSVYEAIDAFAGCRPKAAILTKLDETCQLGSVLSALIERGLPAAYFTDGQQVPEDLHRVRIEVLIQRCFEAKTKAAPFETTFEVEDWIAHASA